MQNTLFANLQLSLKAFLDHILDPVAQGINSYLANHLIREGEHQQHPGIILSYSTLAQIKHGSLIQLSGSRSVRTFDVVVVNLKKWFGVDLCSIRQ